MTPIGGRRAGNGRSRVYGVSEMNCYRGEEPCGEAVKWNEFNQAVQCHRCGQVYSVKRVPLVATFKNWLLSSVRPRVYQALRDSRKQRGWLCSLGLHAWRWFTCEDGHENRGCRRCPKMQARPIDGQGLPLDRWQEFEPTREPWGPEY